MRAITNKQGKTMTSLYETDFYGWTIEQSNFALAGYDYNISYPLTNGGRGSWDNFLVNSQYRGTLNEGLHQKIGRAHV